MAQTPASRQQLADRRRALISDEEPASPSGRIASMRSSSGAVFVDIHQSGRLIQACALAESPAFPAMRGSRLGDWISLDGSWGATRSGDRAFFIQSAALIARCEPGFAPWSEPMSEEGSRERPDWARASDPARMARARGRMMAVQALRGWATGQGLLEAITPILSRDPSGALAAPFWTRSSSLGDLALRVAPENALIRLMCSGFDSLYEIGPSFRNEGVSSRHHPEFLMMEAYRVGWRLDDALSAAENSVQAAWSAAGGAPFDRWARLRIDEALEAFGCPAERVHDHQWLRAELAAAGRIPEVDDLAMRWQALDELFSPPDTPCAVIGHPEQISPLAAPDPEHLGASSRFELYLGGIEIGNGYEQLRDAQVQAERFSEQAARAGSGREAMAQDSRYMDAMGLGMPALAGFGIGIDRLVQLAFGCSIREALQFPLQGS